jgi:pantothenate kinase
MVRDSIPPPGRLLGLTGAPGAGKSTYAAWLAAERDGVIVPMDGFHLPQAELERLGVRDRMGAPETFDAEGYAAVLSAIRRRAGTVLAPAFDRTIEEPVPGAIAVGPEAALVIAEGNYLLLDEPGWVACRDQLDEVWHLRVDESLRLERLIARHVEFGKSPAEAQAWVDRVDRPNAALVEAAAARADRIIDLTGWPT